MTGKNHPHLSPPPSRGRREEGWIPACAGMTYRGTGMT